MPRRLLLRCQPDSIAEFREAALRRYNDGLALAIQGQRTGAIYLWGYSAEMILKAAYFALRSVGTTTSLTWANHILPAIQRGRTLGVIWPNQGAGHNVRAWADLLIVERNQPQQTPYSIALAQELQRHAQRIELLWRETLRYHPNRAYVYEMAQIRQATEWFLANSAIL